jgi:hypothetical protein
VVWETLNREGKIQLIEAAQFYEQRGAWWGLRSRNFRAQKLASGGMEEGGELGFFSMGAQFFSEGG